MAKKTSLKRTLAIVGAGAVAGGIGGFAIEQHTNEVSAGRVITIDTCLKTIPHETTINQLLLNCMEGGVPGGNKIADDSLKEGQPIEFVTALRQEQQNEADTADIGNIALYSLGGAAIVTLVALD